MCYFICEHRFNEFFGAGCNSKTDSIVWMVEDTKVFFVFFRPREDFSWGFPFGRAYPNQKEVKR